MEKQPINSKYLLGIFIALWFGLFLFNLIKPNNFINQYEFDSLTALTVTKPVPKSPIILIAVDEPSFAELGVQWPWPRKLYAQLIQQVQDAGATVIAIDIGFYDQSSVVQEDLIFADAIRKSGIVVLSSYTDHIENQWLSQTRTVSPLNDFIEAGAKVGNVNVILDSDGVLRKLPTQDHAFWSIIANQYMGTASLATEHGNSYQYICYSAAENSFRRVSFYQALDPEKFLPEHYFDDAIVIVGFMNNVAPILQNGSQDTLLTPYTRFTGKAMFGTEVHAHLIHSALTRSHLTNAPLLAWVLMFTLSVLFSSLIFGKWHPVSNAISSLVFSLLMILVSLICFIRGIWLSGAILIIGIWLIYLIKGGFAYTNELSLRRYLRKAFSRYVSDNIINLILANPNKLNLGGEREVVSFLFTDIADFTPLTENTSAELLVESINDYFEGMSRIILSYNGTIERFVGDSLVVFFNAPVKQNNHPLLAVQCALELNDFGAKFSRQQMEKGIPFGKTRIGINTGIVSVGNFGGKKRFHYTAMGDAINVAARLESANKVFGGTLCVSNHTAKQCPEILFRPIGEFRLKGKQDSQLILEPIHENKFSDQYLQQYLNAYKLIHQDNQKAQLEFEDLLTQKPNDYLLFFHLKRLKNNNENCIDI